MQEPTVYKCPYCKKEFDNVYEHFKHIEECEKKAWKKKENKSD